MEFRLDHIVIAITDLDQAVEDYRALGFTVVPGGRHAGRASRNALVAFDDGSYLELLSWDGPGEGRWREEHARHGEGIVDFALVPEDVPRAVQEARVRGLSLEGPTDAGRERPDGQQARWQTARPETFDLPFLCGDLTPRSLRVPEGEARKHANGVTGVSALRVAVHDPEASLARYSALLGPEIRADGSVAERADPLVVMPASGIRMAVIRCGAAKIILLSPPPNPDWRTGALDAILRMRLAMRGEGPVSMTLKAVAGTPARTFRERQAHAQIEIGP